MASLRSSISPGAWSMHLAADEEPDHCAYRLMREYCLPRAHPGRRAMQRRVAAGAGPWCRVAHRRVVAGERVSGAAWRIAAWLPRARPGRRALHWYGQRHSGRVIKLSKLSNANCDTCVTALPTTVPTV